MDQLPRSRPVITRNTYAILVALSAGEQTGRELQQHIVGDGVGHYVRDSIIYATLHRLVDMGLVEEDRNYYWLTDRGWVTLKAETRVLEALVGHAKQRVVGSGHGR